MTVSELLRWASVRAGTLVLVEEDGWTRQARTTGPARRRGERVLIPIAEAEGQPSREVDSRAITLL